MNIAIQSPGFPLAVSLAGETGHRFALTLSWRRPISLMLPPILRKLQQNEVEKPTSFCGLTCNLLGSLRRLTGLSVSDK